ncbi:MAG TPA: PGF-pre-PGF domain-containing protein [Alphaproteobacteria bacterium]|nr:PGF-pre-PGF domain-containing protein [Alphaproteobacteria bacterium]
MCSSVSGIKSVLAVVLLLSIFAISTSNVEAAFERYINNSDTIYTLTGNITILNSDSGIYVNASNVTINCTGFNITGTASGESYGIFVNHSTAVNIINCNITGFNYGILYNNSGDSRIDNSEISSHVAEAIKINGANINITNSIIHTNSTCINITGNSTNINHTILNNTLRCAVWINNFNNINAVFDNGARGNIYYLLNGSPSWNVYDIHDYNADGWADTGTSLPFNSTNVLGRWGGSGQDNFPGILDSENPIISYISPTPSNNTYTTSTFLEINLSISEINLANITISIFSGSGIINITNISRNSSSYYLNFTGLNNTVYYFNATAIDSYGRTNTTETRMITVDTTNPVLTYTTGSQANGSTISSTYMTLNFTANETNFKNLTINIYNASGFVESTVHNNSANLTINVSLTSQGSFNYNATLYDLAGNFNHSLTRSVTVDTAGPTITINYPAASGNYSNSTTIINVSLSETGVAWFNINNGSNYTMNTTDNLIFTFTNSSMPDGEYELNFFANDSINNLATDDRRFFIDTSTPYVLYSSTGGDANGTTVNRNHLLINVTSGDMNFKNVTIRIYNSTTIMNTTVSSSANISWNITLQGDGTYYYNTTVYDRAGNSNTTVVQSIIINNSGAPRITVVNPPSRYYNSTNITLNITISKVGTAVVNFQNGANMTMNTTDNLTFTYINGSITTGDYNVTFFAVDENGNYNSSSIPLTIDITNPLIQYIGSTVANGSYVTTNYPSVEVNGSDTNFANITIKVYNSSGLVYNITNTTPNLALIYNLTDGIYYFNATITDLAANSNTTQTRIITVDTISPVPTVNSPSNGHAFNTSNISINISINDTNFANFTIRTFNATGILVNTSTYTSANAVMTLNLTDGTYLYNITSFDLAGNSNLTLGFNFSINTTVAESGGGSGGGGGGGGGSGSGSSGSSSSSQTPITTEESDEVTYSRVWFNLVEGNRTVSISKEGVPVTEIVMDINYSNNSQAQVLQVKAAETNPTEEDLNAEVYKFITIDADIEEGQYESISITFKIEDEWLLNNSINKTNLTVYRFDEDSNKWIPIQATLINQSNNTNYTYYSVKIYANDLLAVGSPILPEIKPIITEIKKNETENKTDPKAEITPIESEKTEVIQASSESFTAKIGKSISNAYDISKEYISTMSKETQILAVLMITSVLLLITLSVGGTLIYRKISETKQENLWRHHYKRHGSITSYEQEAPLQNPPIKIGTPPAGSIPDAPTVQETSSIPKAPSSSKAKEKPERPLTTPELTIRKISQLLQQSEYSLDNGKAEDAKKQYLDAKTLYFDSGIGYEYKSKVYDKMMQIHNRLYK